MLELMRRHRKGFLGTGMVIFCALLMVVFGLGGGGSGGSGAQVAGEVAGQKISYAEYSRSLRFITDRMRQQMGPAFDQFQGQLNLERQAMDSIIARKIIDGFVEDSGFSASQKSVQKEIENIGFFESQGLSQKTLRQFLNSSGYTLSGLEYDTKQGIVQEQLRNLLGDINIVSELEAKKVFHKKNREAKFRFLTIKGEDFADKVNTEDGEALSTFFQENEEKFRKPSSVKYSFVNFSPSSFLSSVEVTEDDLSLEYDDLRQSGKFLVPAKVQLRQIVFKKPKEKKEKNELAELVGASSESGAEAPLISNESSEAAIKAKAEAVLERLDKKEDFASLAKELSEDKDSAENGGDLGLKAYKNIQAKLASSARELDIGEYSEAIELPDGFYIIKLEASEEQRIKPLSEVKAEVEATVRSNLAGEYAYAEAEQQYSNWKDSGKTLAEFAKTNKLVLKQADKLLEPGQLAKGGLPGLTDQVIKYGADAKELIQVSETPIIVETAEFKESFIPELAAVKEKVIEQYKLKVRGELAQKKAETLLKLAQEAKPAAQRSALTLAAEKEKLELSETEKKTRATAQGAIFNTPNGRTILYSLIQQKPLAPQVFQDGENFYLAELVESSMAEGSDFAKSKKDLLEQEKNQAAARIFSSLQEGLKARTEFSVNPDLIKG